MSVIWCLTKMNLSYFDFRYIKAVCDSILPCTSWSPSTKCIVPCTSSSFPPASIIFSLAEWSILSSEVCHSTKKKKG